MNREDNINGKPTILLIGANNSLVKDLLSLLSTLHLSIYYFENTYPLNINYRRHVKLDNNYIKVEDLTEISNINFDYLIYVNLNERFIFNSKHGIKFESKFVEEIIKSKNLTETKKLFVFPVLAKLEDKKYLQKFNKSVINKKQFNSSSIFVPEPVGDDNQILTSGLIDRLIKDLAEDNLHLSTQDKIFLIESEILSKEIVRNIFSFGAHGKNLSIITKPVSFFKINKLLNNKDTQIKHNTNMRLFEIETDKKIKLIFNELIIFERLKSRFEYLGSLISDKTKPFPENNKESKTKLVKPLPHNENQFTAEKSTTQKKETTLFNKTKIASIYFVSTIFLILLSPFITLLITGSIMRLGVRAEPQRIAKKIISNTKKLNLGNIALTNYLIQISHLGNIYKTPNNLSVIIEMVININDTDRVLSAQSFRLYENLLKDEGIQKEELIKFALNIENIKLNVGFIEAEIDSLDSRGRESAHKIFGEDYIDKTKNSLDVYGVVYKIARFAETNQNGRIAFIIQNENILRPTGGKIEYVILVNLAKGIVNGVNTYNTDDPQLAIVGEVEPPYQLKQYLDIQDWTIDEANWDSDFEKASERVVWFIEKSLGVKIDKVVYLDNKLVESILDSYWNSELSVNRDQTENVLSLVKYFSSLDSKRLNKSLGILVDNLKSKHLGVGYQVKSEDAVLGLSNYVNGCLENCHSDTLEIIDSNLSDTVYSGEIERKFELTVNIDEGSIKHRLVTSYINESGGVYKLYSRIVTPENSSIGLVGLGDEQIRPTLFPYTDKKVAGVYFDVNPYSSRNAEYLWESPHTDNIQNGYKYQLHWIKQPGTDDDDIDIIIEFDKNLDYSSPDKFTLTAPGVISYNTKLSTDTTIAVYFYYK
jgi:hypothetical protein